MLYPSISVWFVQTDITDYNTSEPKVSHNTPMGMSRNGFLVWVISPNLAHTWLFSFQCGSALHDMCGTLFVYSCFRLQLICSAIKTQSPMSKWGGLREPPWSKAQCWFSRTPLLTPLSSLLHHKASAVGFGSSQDRVGCSCQRQPTTIVEDVCLPATVHCSCCAAYSQETSVEKVWKFGLPWRLSYLLTEHWGGGGNESVVTVRQQFFKCLAYIDVGSSRTVLWLIAFGVFVVSYVRVLTSCPNFAQRTQQLKLSERRQVWTPEMSNVLLKLSKYLSSAWTRASMQ